MRSWPRILAALPLVTLGACGGGTEDLSVTKLATNSDIKLWTENGNVIPVCWETAGYDREKKIVKDAVIGTWQHYALLEFTGWGPCPTTGTEKHVRVRLRPQGADNGGAGGSARMGMGALSSAEQNDPGVNFSFNPDGTAGVNRVEYIGVHEFGHVLGFIHEHDAPGNEGPGACAGSLDPKVLAITGYDRDSVMNYCNRDNNGTGNLTDYDIIGVQAKYGIREVNTVAYNSCVSAPSKARATLAAPWNDGGRATTAVYSNSGTNFDGWLQRSVRDGGWGDEVRWGSGDFNGDGFADTLGIWNNRGTNALTVRLTSGTTFIGEHWAVNAGGWMDSTKWLPGDFNGDGKTDVAAVWDNGGQNMIAVFPSDGTKFLWHSQWADRDGGFIAASKWTVGDVNGDGRDDLIAAWNNGGRTTLTVRVANANHTFSPVHFNADAGRYRENTVFLAGDYNGDGRADVAELWDDVGQNSINVHLSGGTSFAAPYRAVTRDGGRGPWVRWIPGDFNGDGRTDIAAAWPYYGDNVLTVRASDGYSFAATHWLEHAGGWLDSTAWCSGRF